VKQFGCRSPFIFEAEVFRDDDRRHEDGRCARLDHVENRAVGVAGFDRVLVKAPRDLETAGVRVAVKSFADRLLQTLREKLQPEGFVDLFADTIEPDFVRVAFDLEHGLFGVHLHDVHADPGFDNRTHERERRSVELSFGKSVTIAVW
jgi:hypothetical protein